MENKDNTKEKFNMSWHFPDLDHGKADGLNDPTLQYFEGNHEWYIAREAIQNSIDARLDYDAPVVVDFEKRIIPAAELPGRDELQQRVQSCLERSQVNSDDKGVAYFEQAAKILDAKQVTLLRVGDYNTLGLDGEDEDESGRWYRLVKSVGENRMTGAGGGSYGIGKGAPIAASKIRTVYYSTLNEDSPVFQGCASLITHDFDGKKRRGTGFFGEDGYKSLRDESVIPQGFLRNGRGTDVYIAAYNSEGDDWMTALVKSVLENFWMAIYAGDLEVRFVENDGDILINTASLANNLQKYATDSAYQYYLAVVKPTRKEEKQHPILGSCVLYVRQDPDLIKLKNIALMRKPKMVVNHRPFRVMQDGYVGVFVCDDDEGNRVLRDMEPPEHNEWNSDLHPDKTKARKALQEMVEWIKDTLREMANAGSGDPEDIEGLDRYLPFEDEDEVSGGSVNMRPSDDVFVEESPVEVGAQRDEVYDEVEDIVQRPTATQRSSGTESGSTGPTGKAPIDSSGGGKGGSDKGDALSRINTSGIKFRTIAASGKDGEIEYCLILDPAYEQSGALNIIAVGDDNNYPVTLAYAQDWDSGSDYKVSGSFIKELSMEKGVRRKIRIGLHSNIRYALGIESYEG